MIIVVNVAQPTGKFILNESAVIFFPQSQKHSEVKSHGLSYEDDYRGNAVAGTFGCSAHGCSAHGDGRVDIRYHEQFSEERIRSLWLQVITDERLSFLRGWQLYYQGRSQECP